MSNFNLTHTGQVVDDAITKVTRDDYNGTHATVATLLTHLQGLSSLPSAGTLYQTNGRTAYGDAPTRIFAVKSGSHTDNTGTIRTISGTNYIEMLDWDGDARDFGAVGDNSTDNSTTLSNWINRLVADGVEGYLPTGTYLCPSWAAKSITSKLTIRGEQGSIIKNTNATKPIFLAPTGSIVLDTVEFDAFDTTLDFAASRAVIDLIDIRNCTFKNHVGLLTGGCISYSSLNAVGPPKTYFASGVTRLNVHNCVFEDSVCNGIRFDCAIIHEANVIENKFEDLTRVGFSANGVLLGVDDYDYQDDVNKINIRGNLFKDISTNDNFEAHGILVYGHEVIITDNHLEDIQNEQTTTGSDGGTGSEGIYVKALYCVISNNTLFDAGQFQSMITIKGLRRDSTSGPQGYGVIVTNNVLVNSGENDFSDGTTAQDTAGITIATESVLCQGNYIEGMSQHGIAVRQNMHNDHYGITIDSNQIVNCNRSIMVQFLWKNLKITNNLINTDTRVGTQMVSIQANTSSGTASYIDGIDISGNMGIQNHDSGTSNSFIYFANSRNAVYNELNISNNFAQARGTVAMNQAIILGGSATSPSAAPNWGLGSTKKAFVTLNNNKFENVTTPYNVVNIKQVDNALTDGSGSNNIIPDIFVVNNMGFEHASSGAPSGTEWIAGQLVETLDGVYVKNRTTGFTKLG